MAIKMVAACGYKDVDLIKRGNLKLTNKNYKNILLKIWMIKRIQILPRVCKG